MSDELGEEVDENYDSGEYEPGFGEPEGVGEEKPKTKTARPVVENDNDTNFQPGGGPAYK